MSTKYLLMLVLAISVFSSLSSAMATCGMDAFRGSCQQCTFDANGKMDKACWSTYEEGVKTCLAGAYPVMAGKYYFGGCPQLDTCVQRVQACKAMYTTNSDAKDCNSPAIISCTEMGDICAEAANKVCADGENEDESGFNNVSAGGTKFNDTMPANDTGLDESIIIIEEENPFAWLCLGFGMVLIPLFMGALFYKRR